MENALTHRVIMDRRVLEAAPEYVKQEARLRFEEIAEGVRNIAPDSAFWASVRVSRLCLAVGDWSFYYILDDETLRVTEVRRK
jgi:hypothetical protein